MSDHIGSRTVDAPKSPRSCPSFQVETKLSLLIGRGIGRGERLSPDHASLAPGFISGKHDGQLPRKIANLLENS